jgi:rhomboid protease GlpG
MRQAGTIATEAEAARFADYLFAHGVAAKVEPDGNGWAVWVRDEEQVARATEELNQFVANPTNEKYVVAGQEAKARRENLARREKEARRNFVDLSRRWDGRGAGPAPLTRALVAISIAVAIFTRLGGYFPRDSREGPDTLLSVLQFTESPEIKQQREAAGETWHPLDAIRRGQVWRLITPIFLHFSPLHLLFNMYMLYQFGRLVESRRGTLRFALLVLVIALVSNYCQYYFMVADHVFPSFGGMSGVLYGLFGYAWMKSRYDPTADIYIDANTVVMLMVWFVLCLVGLIGNIANWAHAGGLAVGVIIGISPYAWRRTVRYLRASRP